MLYGTTGAAGVFYDAPTDTVFWSDIFGELFVGAADGSSFRVLYSFPAGFVRDIQVLNDTVYWVDNTSLFAAPADGSGPITTLATPGHGNLRALDIYHNKIYLGEFTDRTASSTDTISVANLDGSNVTILYQGQFGSLRGLAVGTNPAGLRLCADQNGDGVVSPADYNGWIIAFNAGTNGPRCLP